MAFSKFLDPKNNCAFQRIFGTEKNEDILIHFINDILGLTGKAKIKNVIFLGTGGYGIDAESIVDVFCRDYTGVHFVCKIQLARDSGLVNRAQFYAAEACAGQVGSDYKDFKGAFLISIAGLILFPNKVAYKSDHTFFDNETNENDLRDLNFTFIELPKFPKTKEDQLENMVEKWCYFFKYASDTREEDLDRIVDSDVIIKRAYEEMNKGNWSEKELLEYEQEEKHFTDEIATLDQEL